MAVTIIFLGFVQGGASIGYAGARAQSIGQLRIENGDYFIYFDSGLKAAERDPSSHTSRYVVVKVGQGRPNSGQLRTHDADYLSGVEQYDWCAGYALYRYTLEVNGVNVSQVPQWENALRRYCSSKAKPWNLVGELRSGGAQWEPDYGYGRTEFKISSGFEFQWWKMGALNLENGKILGACFSVDGRDDLSIYSLVADDDMGIPVPSKSLWVGDNMKSSNDPSITPHDKSGTSPLVCSDLDNGVRRFSTCFDVREWLNSVLAISCNAKKWQNSKAAQPHRTIPPAGEAQ